MSAVQWDTTISDENTDVQSQTAVTAYFSSKQLLLFVFDVQQ